MPVVHRTLPGGGVAVDGTALKPSRETHREVPYRGVKRHAAAPAACEPMFVTSHGSAYSRFQRALTTGNLQLIEAVAAEVPKVSLEDALAILMCSRVGETLGSSGPRRGGWGRLLTETPADLSDARFALALVERLPSCRDALHGLARRR